jgi:hypothetical protein
MKEGVLLDQYPQIKVGRKTGGEPFELDGKSAPFNLINFWQWSSSDLPNNTIRGVLAEYIVASALGCHNGTRVEWDAYDLITKEGIKIEVKSAAYIQSWSQSKLSSIKFGIQPTKGWDATTNITSDIRERQADVYVFCLLEHKDQETINPLSLDQWEFYVLATSVLNERLGEQKSISLSSLLKLDPKVVAYGELSEAINQAGGIR